MVVQSNLISCHPPMSFITSVDSRRRKIEDYLTDLVSQGQRWRDCCLSGCNVLWYRSRTGNPRFADLRRKTWKKRLGRFTPATHTHTRTLSTAQHLTTHQ
jgi:hypothetical protein